MNEILFLYNWVPLTQKRGAYAECAGTNTVNDIKKALHALGHYVICVNLLNQEQLERLVNYHHIGRAFVIAEGYLDFPEFVRRQRRRLYSSGFAKYGRGQHPFGSGSYGTVP